ncbi:MAG: TIGR02587 family membrane protein [Oscillatoria sp. PMC 1051.18]|nr:TIGR02587 family membrane protein [Oscillatoria sp. PMC 1050.18]MEC5032653.1 TIGR02587 family membrane protein [Oscillatoria sp. PMC 1051.18]
MVKHIRKYQRGNNWREERQDLLRGASGGFLFGIPLLYTMEVWWIGSFVEPPLLLIILIVTYVVVLLLNRIEGFRKNKRDSLRDAAAESVEALGIGILCATFILVLLNRITFQTSLDEIIGKIIFESVPFSLGVALARVMLSGEPTESTQQEDINITIKITQKTIININESLADLNATLIGAMIIAFNIAPTDEVSVLAAASSPPRLLVIIASSLLISYCIVFAAGFINQEKRYQQRGYFQTPLGETVFCYLISLLASALMLWFFQRLSLGDPWFLWLRYTLILGLPASIGGAAGRLAI